MSLPPASLSGTYAERIAYATASLTPGQYWFQTDAGPGTLTSGPYFWVDSTVGWVRDDTQAQGGVDYDGRGQNLGSGGAVRINNSDNSTTWISANPTSASAFIGLWRRTIGIASAYVIGLYVSQSFLTSIRTLVGNVLGLWSTLATGASLRMLDISYSSGRHNTGLRFGGNQLDTSYGGIPCHYTVNVTEAGNVSSSETDALTISFPAYGLSSDGGNNQAIDIFVWGVTAANANNKRARLAFGSTVVADTTSSAANNLVWSIHAKIYRTGANTQKYFGEANFEGDTIRRDRGTATETETAAINIIVKLTGTATDEITVLGTEVMVYN